MESVRSVSLNTQSEPIDLLTEETWVLCDTVIDREWICPAPPQNPAGEIFDTEGSELPDAGTNIAIHLQFGDRDVIRKMTPVERMTQYIAPKTRTGKNGTSDWGTG